MTTWAMLKVAVAGAALIGVSQAASAMSYNFNVNYFGDNNASLAAGSDDPLAQTLNTGDDFTYTLTGQNGVFSTAAGGDIFPFIALGVNEPGDRVSDFTLNLLNNGVSVFSDVQSDADNQQVHLGANDETLPGGLIFNQIVLHDTIVSATNLDGTGSIGSTPNSILPIFGSPDENKYYPGVVLYSGNTAAVPEPASWAMMIFGVGGIGGLMRRAHRRSEDKFSAKVRAAALA